MEKILDRFLRYVAIDTQSDENSESQPSAAKELDLLKLLCKELNDMGVEATLDEYGYVMGSIPSNIDKKVPAIGFIAHVDTSPDASGKDVKPQIIKDYDGGDIALKGVPGLFLRPSEFPELLSHKGQTIIMLCGLQGAGKTTNTGKLAGLFKKQGKNPLLCACDIYRPAAIKQLQVVGSQVGVPVFEMGQTNPVDVAKAAIAHAVRHGNDMVFLDTAGRLHVDEALMDELKAVKAAVKPNEILLVVDAMTGQDAVNAAKAFDEALGIDGVLLTKLDGDARGGAALSIRAATGKPIKFVGTGEKLDMIEPFHPDRMASRILGMGDMLTFIEKAEQQYDEEQAKKLEEKLRKNRLTLSDYLDQLEQLQNMGDLSQIADMLPGGMAKGFDPSQIDEKQMAHNKAIIRSMTPRERENPQILNASRKKRIAAGCGLEVVDVNRLLKSFEMLQQMTKAMTKGKFRGLGGMMGGMPNMNRMHGFGRKKRLK